MQHGETGDGGRNGLFCARDRARMLVPPPTNETERLRRTLWVTAPYCMTTGLTGSNLPYAMWYSEAPEAQPAIGNYCAKQTNWPRETINSTF